MTHSNDGEPKKLVNLDRRRLHWAVFKYALWQCATIAAIRIFVYLGQSGSYGTGIHPLRLMMFLAAWATVSMSSYFGIKSLRDDL